MNVCDKVILNTPGLLCDGQQGIIKTINNVATKMNAEPRLLYSVWVKDKHRESPYVVVLERHEFILVESFIDS